VSFAEAGKVKFGSSAAQILDRVVYRLTIGPQRRALPWALLVAGSIASLAANADFRGG
jgi:hypothetical protein